ncbi:hypothetical protein [Streptomyces sp. NBRC 110035]|uniref:hypothetical protein n=1 Tax=Streptomyces sp. NBRC 110035 TaxID=1547867 RepID=UPI0005A8D996|nr:hypothetical protein [Streptomyces sp. NBRC 110035]
MDAPSELADALEDFHGFAWIPGLAKILDGLADMDTAIRAGHMSTDATQTLLTILGNPSVPDLPHLLAVTVQTLTGPDNPTLHHLPDDIRKNLQHLGELHAFETAEYIPRDHTNEAAALITENRLHTRGEVPAMTEEQRKELSRKNAEKNKQSINRPR